MPPPTAPIAIGTASTVQPIPIEPGNTLKKKLAALNMTAQKPNATREVIFFPAGAMADGTITSKRLNTKVIPYIVTSIAEACQVATQDPAINCVGAQYRSNQLTMKYPSTGRVVNRTRNEMGVVTQRKNFTRPACRGRVGTSS